MDINKLQMIGKNILAFFEGGVAKDEIELAGQKIYIDTRYEPEHHVREEALAVSSGNKSKVPQGAKIWVNYLVADQSRTPIHKSEKGDYYLAKEDEVFLWEYNGDKKTTGVWIIVEPNEFESHKTTDSGIIIQNKDVGNEKYGKVVFSNDDIEKKTGIKVGDTVMLHDNAHYAFDYKGEKLYRVHSELSVLAVKL